MLKEHNSAVLLNHSGAGSLKSSLQYPSQTDKIRRELESR